MAAVRKFDLEVVATHKCFYLLRDIRGVDQVQLMHNTPAGHIETDVADVFSMPNGRIIVAWKYPLNTASMHNLIAISGTTVENVNLIPLERVIDIYDRPVDARVGTFIFTNSDMVISPGTDWRCDNGKFGPTPFQQGVRIIDHLSEISVYEPVISVNGIGHLIYIEGVAKQNEANHYLLAGELPTVGRTLWETIKLIHEWAIVNDEPFNNREAVSYKANMFLKEIGITSQELSVIDAQVSMQVANYLLGNTNARQRPDGIMPMTNEIKKMLFSRVASCSISALEYMNPGMWDLEELLEVENTQLRIDMFLFENTKRTMSPDRPAIAIQNRIFANKQIILDMVSAATL